MIPDAFFTPRSVAVVGVSANPQSFGTRQLRSLIGFGYKGLLYPVNPSGGEFFGLKAYPNLRDIPGNVDLAIICVPARAVASVVQDCLAKGTLAVEVLSAGFGELDEEGRSLELELTKLSLKGVRILGPNCFGVYCPAGGLSIVPGANFSKEGGSVGLIAQSGQFAEMIAMQAKGLGIRFSKSISYGNACDVGEADLLEYLKPAIP